jgi:hypothetical protein
MVFLVSNLQILAKNQFGVEKSSKSWCGAPFLLPLPKMVMVLRKFVYIIKRDFFLARFEFFTTSNILGKLLVGA